MTPSTIVCTTVKRGASEYHLSGRIVEMELPKGIVTKDIELPFQEEVYGPRGGNRGARGVRVFRDRVYVAMHSRILVYDLHWKLLGAIRHPHVVGHHEIEVDREGIWCCSTIVDAVIKLDFSGNKLWEFWASEDAECVRWLGIREIKWDREIDYTAYRLPMDRDAHPNKQLHINTTQIYQHQVFAFDSNCQALFRVYPSFKPVARNCAWDHAHNVTIDGNRILVNNSAACSFEIWRKSHVGSINDQYELERKIIFVDGDRKSTQFSVEGWIRGRVQLGNGEYIVGSNPACLFYVKDGNVIDRWVLSNDINEAIHGLTLKSTV
jgi:hypothetical protein